MIAALKAEFLKLFTVRSTYVIIAFVMLMILFFAGYIEGSHADSKVFQNPYLLSSEVTNALGFTVVFCAIIAILLFSHEYRYNTIMHTLTSNSRSKVLMAKILVMTGFAAVFALVMGTFSPLMAYLGNHLAGHQLVAQTIPISDLLWRGLFFTWGYAMIGLLLVALTRNQIFSIVALILFPTTVEGIAQLLLKKNVVYLPFTALGHVMEDSPDITHTKAALVFLTYLIIGWIVAWILFLRRDAN